MIKKLLIKYKEIILYLVFGGLTTAVSLGIYYGLTLTVLDPNNAVQLQIANVVSWIGAVAFAYFTNRKFVFDSKNQNKVKEAGKFVAARITTLLMDMLVMFLGVTVFHFSDKIMKLVAQVVVLIGNYIFSKFIVFKKEK